MIQAEIKKASRFKILKLQILFKEWCLSSSFQFLSKLYQYENNFQRLLWIIIFVTFSFGTFWFFIMGILDYLEFDVVSKIRVYNEKTIIFAYITICEIFPFSSKNANNLLENYLNEKSEENLTKRDENFLSYLSKVTKFNNNGMNIAFHFNNEIVGVRFEGNLTNLSI